MSVPVVHRRRHRGPDHTLLPSLAGIVDRATADAPGHVMVCVAGPIQPEVELGFRPLDADAHPFDQLAGFEAPEDWSVFGLRTTGRSRHLDDPQAPPRRVAGTFLVDRRGREASVLRFDDDVIEPTGPAEGTIADLCRRVLGLPTADAPASPAPLWIAIWLDRLIERWGQPERRRELTSWAQIAILHPAVHTPSPTDLLTVGDPASLASVARAHAAVTTWHDLRHAAEPIPLPDGPLPPDISRWMDDGFFARWALGAFPPLMTTALEVRQLLGGELGGKLVNAMVAILEP